MTLEHLAQLTASLLREYPPDTLVVVNMGRNELANGCEVSSIEYTPAVRWQDHYRWYEDCFPALSDDTDTRSNVLNILG